MPALYIKSTLKIIVYLSGVNCGIPPNLTSGSGTQVYSGTQYTDNVTYICSAGWEIPWLTGQGEAGRTFTRVCQHDATWTDLHRNISCQSKCIIVFALGIDAIKLH